MEEERKMKREIRLSGLFLEYGEEQFRKWCRILNLFRFCKSHPYPDDLKPDRFVALTNFENDDELENMIVSMKIELRMQETTYIDLTTINTTFSSKAAINDVLCYIDINKIQKTLLIEISGTENDQFSLDNTTFQRAKNIDDFLSTLKIKWTYSPYNDDYCITPEFYPEVWK